MKIKWLGHASFLITTERGTKIITDPYTAGGNINYGDINESAHIVTVSHDHFDHNNVAAVRGKPEVIKGIRSQETRGIRFQGIPTYHDESKGSQRGTNTIFCFTVDGIRVCHLGDLGHRLTNDQITEIGGVDILLLPVGGFYTIDAAMATEIYENLKPRIVIPMHFKNVKCTLPIVGVEDFIKEKQNVRRGDSSEIEFKSGNLPSATEIVVLPPAL